MFFSAKMLMCDSAANPYGALLVIYSVLPVRVEPLDVVL